MASLSVKVVAKNLRASPRKLNDLLSLIRGKELDYAQREISFSKKKAAKDVYKAIQCCINNMQHKTNDNGLDGCYISEAYVGKGMTLKRIMPRARGRAYRIRKTYSNLTIVLNRDMKSTEDKR